MSPRPAEAGDGARIEAAAAKGQTPPAPPPGRSGRSGWAIALLTVVAALLAADRALVLGRFSFGHVDQDQALMWLVATETAHGRLHEPCFYGQAYNPPVEGWLAAPLVRAHVPPHIALPLVTCALSLLPFVLLSAAAWRLGPPWAASLPLLVPLVLPVEYAILTTVPRGWVSGVALAAPAAALWLLGRGAWAWLAAAFISVVALTVGPNAAPLLLAAGVRAWSRQWRYARFYAAALAGAALAAPLPWAIRRFYDLNPGYDFHRVRGSVAFSFSTFGRSFDGGQLDTMLGHLSPLAGRGWVVLALLLALAILLAVSGRGGEAAATGAALLITVYALGIPRVHEGARSVFFPAARMFLAVPVVLALALVWLAPGLERRGRLARVALLAGLLGLAAARDRSVLRRPEVLLAGTDRIEPRPVAELVATARALETVERDTGSAVLLIPRGTGTLRRRGEVLAYAGPAVTDLRLITLFPPYDRRTWLLQRFSREAGARVLLYVEDNAQVEWAARAAFPTASIALASPRVLLVPTGGRTPLAVARVAGIEVRPF